MQRAPHLGLPWQTVHDLVEEAGRFEDIAAFANQPQVGHHRHRVGHRHHVLGDLNPVPGHAGLAFDRVAAPDGLAGGAQAALGGQADPRTEVAEVKLRFMASLPQ